MTIAELEVATTSTAILSTGTTMKALVYHGPGKRAWEDKPRPTIQDPGDAIVRITTSTICGTDLHILIRYLPGHRRGRRTHRERGRTRQASGTAHGETLGP